jgi:Response regulator of the LytR/AlgR family
MLKVVVCIEQEELKVKYIDYLERLGLQHKQPLEIETFEDSKQLLFEWSDRERYADIIFLGTTAIDELQVAKELRARGVEASIVLLVKDKRAAVDAFALDVLRCISIDDMDWERQRQIIDAAIHRCEEQIHQHIVLKTREETCKILLRDIHYFETANHKATVYYQRRGQKPEEFIFGGSINKLAHILVDKGFVRPNSAQLVAKSYAKQLVKNKLVLQNDVEVSISKMKRNEIKKAME